MTPLVISGFTTVSGVGRGVDAMAEALSARRSGLAPCSFEPRLQTYTGRVAGLEEVALMSGLTHYDCRNNRLAQLGLEQDGFRERMLAARERYGPSRIAVIIGTSTSGIGRTEEAYRHRDPASGALPTDFHLETTHNLFATPGFVRHYLGLTGPALTISTACSSSAKVFASAWRLMAAGLCDAALVGGADSLCLNTLYGFSALELVAEGRCTPCAPDRTGINIGEAAGYALLEWPDQAREHSGVALLGYGESSDAYHMSTPRPDGGGAVLAMRRALECAALPAAQVDYINMHGTASEVNDSMEDKAITAVFGRETACSSTKGWTGHTLGAAGITEAIIGMLSIQKGLMPGTLNTATVDPSFTSRILLENETGPVGRVLSNSFGFGGSNCSIVLGAVA